MQKTTTKNAELRRGVTVFAALAVLTAIEYAIGVMELPTLFLWAIALVKAGLVIWFFMHVFRVFGAEDGEHS